MTLSVSRPATPSNSDLRQLQHAFVGALPRIEAHGRICFRNQTCASTREECLAEMRALSWQWFVCLCKRGKDPSCFISAIAGFAARAVRSGRRLCGQERAKDALSPRAQRQRNFAVGKLPDFSMLSDNPLTDALIDNTQSPPDIQAAFRIDFPAWLASLGRRDRALALDMALGHTTQALARTYGLSPGRISQLRQEFHDDWERFCGERPRSDCTSALA